MVFIQLAELRYLSSVSICLWFRAPPSLCWRWYIRHEPRSTGRIHTATSQYLLLPFATELVLWRRQRQPNSSRAWKRVKIINLVLFDSYSQTVVEFFLEFSSVMFPHIFVINFLNNLNSSLKCFSKTIIVPPWVCVRFYSFDKFSFLYSNKSALEFGSSLTTLHNLQFVNFVRVVPVENSLFFIFHARFFGFYGIGVY